MKTKSIFGLSKLPVSVPFKIDTQSLVPKPIITYIKSNNGYRPVNISTDMKLSNYVKSLKNKFFNRLQNK